MNKIILSNTYFFKSQEKSFKLLSVKLKSNIISKIFTVKQSNPLPSFVNESPQELDVRKLNQVLQIFKEESSLELVAKELDQVLQDFKE